MRLCWLPTILFVFFFIDSAFQAKSFLTPWRRSWSFSPISLLSASTSTQSPQPSPLTSVSSLLSEAASSPSFPPQHTLRERIGDNALIQVQRLGSRVADSEGENERRRRRLRQRRRDSVLENLDEWKTQSVNKLDGVGGSVYSNTLKALTRSSVMAMSYGDIEDASFDGNEARLSNADSTAITSMAADNQYFAKERQVWQALANLESDMQLLDRMTGQKPQLSPIEVSLLVGAVISAASGPLLLGGHITEFLAPSAAAFAAAIGIGAEYTGKVAVADGKEVAAASIQCAAEADGFLANAERAKAITPLCVGIGATAASFALLVPVFLDSLGVAFNSNLQLMTEIYLFCPLVSVLAAAVASLALQETVSFCNQAIGVGNRRFARSGLVGRSWMSCTEQIERKSQGAAFRWKTFSWAVLPAPVLGALVPGALPTKTIVVAALAAAQSAYFTAEAERILSRATDAVALKARSAAVCDTYANQGARSAAILPFTSALSGLCAAATAAIVELPFVESLSSANTFSATALEMFTVSVFPLCSALFAAAASVSKARCQVDAQASMLAASTIALPYDDDNQDPILRPFKGVLELIRLTLTKSVREPLRRFVSKQLRRVLRFFRLQ